MSAEKSKARLSLEAYVAKMSKRMDTFPIYEIVLFTKRVLRPNSR